MKTRSELTGKAAGFDSRASTTRPTATPTTRPPRPSPSILASQAADQWRAPQFVWQVRDELGEILCGDAHAVREDRHRRLHGDHHARLQDAADRREVGLRGGHRAQLEQPVHDPQEPQDPAQRVGLDHRPRRAQPPQRGGRRRRLPDRRGPRLLGLRVLHVQGQQEVPAPVRRPVRRLAPARLVDQAARVPDRPRRPDDDRRVDVHGRRDQLRAARSSRVLPDPGRRRSSAARCGSGARSSSRSTSPRSRPGSSTASTTRSTSSRTTACRSPPGRQRSCPRASAPSTPTRST